MKSFFLSFFYKIRYDLWIAFVAGVLVVIFIPLFTYVYFAKDLKTPESLMNRRDTGVTLLDRNGTPFFTFYDAPDKEFVPLSKIPKNMQNAVIAIEDKDFYHHGGFSVPGIVRAIYSTYITKQQVEGGSTLTQQLVKNSLLTSQQTVGRKIQEIILAAEVERRYTKSQILEMYLNSVYFGRGAFGVEEASQSYFGKDVNQLTLPQTAFLASVLQSPSDYEDISSDTENTVREKLVLTKMRDLHDISQSDYQKAVTSPLAFHPNNNINIQAPHFALFVRGQLIKKYGEETVARSGFRVKTTIDLSMQSYAQQEVETQVEDLTPDGVTNASAVVEDPRTAEILAMVGSRDWFYPKFGQVNMAVEPRQPGSSFKPIVYVTGFEQGILTPATILHDVPTTYHSDPNCHLTVCYYSPHDYDNRFRGPVTVRRALSNSLNVPAVETLSKVGIPEAIDTAKNLGITTLQDPSHYGLSLVLGAAEVPLYEMTNVYATFADQGDYNPPTVITDITDKYGKSLYHYSPHPQQVLNPNDVYLISSILSDNRARAEEFGNTLTTDRIAAVKTGTTEDYHDAWTLGYTPYLTVGVWVGNNDGKLMDQVAGSLGAAPIWKDLITKFSDEKDFPNVAFKQPSDVIALNCSFAASESARLEYFVKGTEPYHGCSTGKETSEHAVSLKTKLHVLKLPHISPSPTASPSASSVRAPLVPVAQAATAKP